MEDTGKADNVGSQDDRSMSTSGAGATGEKRRSLANPGSGLETLKLVLISLALVFAVAAFALVLLRGGAAAKVQPPRTLKLPDPPPPPPPVDKDEYTRRLYQQKVEEARKEEMDELKGRQKRADEAVAVLRKKYEKDGKLPEKIVLETPTSRPKPADPKQQQDAMPNTAPLVVYPREKRLEFDAKVVLDSGGALLEILLSGPRGRLHESLLVTFINPYDLWQALALLGLKQTYTARWSGDMVALEGDRAIIEVEYKGKDGKTVRRRVEDFIYDFARNAHMPYAGWVYTGSHFGELADGTAVLIAGEIENIITIWHRPTPVLDNPLKDGGDDTLYRVYEGVVPESGTDLRVIMTVDEKYNTKRKDAEPLTGK